MIFQVSKLATISDRVESKGNIDAKDMSNEKYISSENFCNNFCNNFWSWEGTNEVGNGSRFFFSLHYKRP